MKIPKSPKGIALLIVVIAVMAALKKWQGDAPPPQTGGAETQTVETPSVERGAPSGAVEAAFRAGRSDVMVEGEGTVKKVLPDDNEGSRHQKLILKLASGHTILIAHNIDLAPRIPAERGDRVGFKGEFEYSEQGGVVHWTHHDPRGRHEGGWLEFNGKRYE